MFLHRPYRNGKRIYGKSERGTGATKERMGSPAEMVWVLVSTLPLADYLNFHPLGSTYSAIIDTHIWPMYFIFIYLFIFLILFFFISWRLIILQYCSRFCHTLTWISHGFTCVPHPDPPSRLPPHPIPLGLPSTPALSACLMHPAWAGDLFHAR